MKNTSTTSSVSLGTLLQVAFIVLKLIGVISWKWVWVLSPSWIILALSLVIIVLAAIVKRNKKA